jgi:hypothetical protein
MAGLRKVANMLGYHRQARILGASRRHVNEITVLLVPFSQRPSHLQNRVAHP